MADIIDNSVAAGATEVNLHFEWAGEESWITILDNGRGMTPVELDSAMRLGDRNPLDARRAEDLGRFGLGLKTASFSQARRLTVASKAAGSRQDCLRWDLDLLSDPENGGWHLLEGAEAGSQLRLEELEGLEAPRTGTIVLLEKLDRMVTPGFTSDHFLELIGIVDRHLGMTFHRYLTGPQPRLQLRINRLAIKPWDPFMRGNPGKPWIKPAVSLPCQSPVIVECHVLPHKDKLSVLEHEIAAGVQGWNSGQGFYVYRNERLIVAGSWLGLGAGRQWTKDEAHRLARIRLDITNESDAAWKLDIRKSSAHPPVELRRALTRLAEETRSRARQVFAHRGRTASSQIGEPVEFAWEASKSSRGTRYNISRAHAAVQGVLENYPEARAQVELMLKIIEETVPVQRIWLDTAEDKETPLTAFAGEPDVEVLKVLQAMYESLVKRRGMHPEDARRRLGRTEPFDRYPALVAALPDQRED